MDARPNVRQIKSIFAQMVEHWENVIQECDHIARLCGDLLSQSSRVQDYARGARNQLTDTIEEYHQELNTAIEPDDVPESLKQIAG